MFENAATDIDSDANTMIARIGTYTAIKQDVSKEQLKVLYFSGNQFHLKKEIRNAGLCTAECYKRSAVYQT
ncbi:MAG: hypothetical protein U5J96_15830 [Ignavibacteriaceae bacterium]|nr:hypothetical protein [Ignavibacteriaceae bacterium]